MEIRWILNTFLKYLEGMTDEKYKKIDLDLAVDIDDAIEYN